MRFAQAWADYTKAFAIYPATNVRVRGALEAMLAAFEEALAESGAPHLEVCFHQSAVTFGDEPVDLASGTSLLWLHDRIHRAALAGVRFRPGLAEDALRAFTRTLLDAYGKDGTSRGFQEIWTGAYEGLELLDRRFRGAFVESERQEEARHRSWGEAGGAAIDTSRDDALVEELLEDPIVREAFARLQGRVHAMTQGDEETLDVDLIARIVRQLPADVMRDRDQIRAVAVTAMQRLGLELEDLEGSAGRANAQVGAIDAEMSRLLFDTSQGLLGRAEDPDNHVPELREIVEESGAGTQQATSSRRRRDDAIQDTAEAFRADLAKLPAPWDERFDPGTIGSREEQVGAHLHVLANTDHEENAAVETRAESGLRRILQRPGEHDFRVVRQYLDVDAESTDEAAKAKRARILRSLRRSGVASRLRAEGLVTSTTVAETFPRDFGLYVDTLDPKDAVHMAELEGTLERLGAERILQASHALLHDESVLEPTRLDRLLHKPRRPALPIVKLLLEHGDAAAKRRAADALRAIYAKDPVGALFLVHAERGSMPPWYTEALADGSFDGVAGEGLRRRLAQELVRIVKQEEGDGPRRLDAIRHLGHFPSPESTYALRELIEARRLLLFPREAKPVREAARAALRTASLRGRASHVS